MKLLKPTMKTLRSSLPMLDHAAVPGASTSRPTGSTLKALRRRLFARSGQRCECPACVASGLPVKLTWATFEAHHVVAVADGGSHDISNLMAVSLSCHEALTREQAAGFASRTWADRLDAVPPKPADFDVCG